MSLPFSSVLHNTYFYRVPDFPKANAPFPAPDLDFPGAPFQSDSGVEIIEDR